MSGSDLVLNRGVGSGAVPCRSCRKPIVFAVMHASGKLGPFEVDPDGQWSIVNGIAKHVGPRPQQLELGGAPGPQRFTSHFARCVDAAKWRKPRGDVDD